MSNHPSARDTSSRFEHLSSLIAAGFGSGYSPKAPGTIGSIFAVVLWLAVQRCCPGILVSLVLVGTSTLVGWWAVAQCLTNSRIAANKPGDKVDPSWIVIDEWAGMFIALLPCENSDWALIALSFLLFRFFDVSKVGWVGSAERLQGATGIMADDLVAGLFSAAILFSLQFTGLTS